MLVQIDTVWTLASLMRNDFSETTFGFIVSYFVKITWCSRWFCNHHFIWGSVLLYLRSLKSGFARYLWFVLFLWAISLFLSDHLYNVADWVYAFHIYRTILVYSQLFQTLLQIQWFISEDCQKKRDNFCFFFLQKHFKESMKLIFFHKYFISVRSQNEYAICKFEYCFDKWHWREVTS